MNIRDYIEKEANACLAKGQCLLKMLGNLPPAVGDLESDSIQLFGSWLVLRDTSHKDLGSKIASITGQSVRFKSAGLLRTAVFHNLGPFRAVDLDRPNPKCRKVRALKPAREEILTICGDLPPGYELLEELE